MGRWDGEKEDFLPGSMPYLRLDNVCVAVYLAYHSLTVDHASSQVKQQYQGSPYEVTAIRDY
jgi:hypothetical protein